MFGNMCELVFTAAHSALLALCLNNEEINGDLQLFQPGCYKRLFNMKSQKNDIPTTPLNLSN